MSALLKQHELFEPGEYLKNHSGRAFFSLLTTPSDGGKKQQKSYPVDSMNEVLSNLQSEGWGTDTWISQAEFYVPTRRLVHLSKLGLMFTDLDTYKIGIEGSPEQMTEAFLRYCEKSGIPEPSIVVFSGRGLQAKWLLETALPQAALPRWNALQAEINVRLQAYGADARALDASRVLRLVHTVNSKSGCIVRITHHSDKRYCFDKLAKLLLPFDRNTRSPVSQDSAQVIMLRPGPGEPRTPSNTKGLRAFMGSQLAWDRLADLRKLSSLRKAGANAVPDGQRDLFVFLAAVFLAQATLNTGRFYDELRVLAREFAPHWRDSQVRDAASAALKRMRDFVGGKLVEFKEREVDPRYRFRNETLVGENWLAITPDEEREMKTIMSTQESRRRDAFRAREKRAQAGAIEREGYLANAEQKRATARLLRAQGISWTEIAQQVGYKSGQAARMSCT